MLYWYNRWVYAGPDFEILGYLCFFPLSLLALLFCVNQDVRATYSERESECERERARGMRVVCAPLQLLLNEISKRF